MKFLTTPLIALCLAGLLLTGCGKKEEVAAEPTAVEQSLQEADAAVEQAIEHTQEEAAAAKEEAEDAIAAAREAAGN
jgi:outer membrane murein-binding lipoprotein Lpp